MRDQSPDPSPSPPPRPARRPRRRSAGGVDPATRPGFLGNPRNVILIALGAAVVVGGGRRWWMAIRSRRAIERLGMPDVRPEEVLGAARHGRDVLMDLFRLLGTAQDPAVREAAGRALAILWKQDQLIPEEEKAVVRRGYSVDWHARRRYPRALAVPIPISATYGAAFLGPSGPGVGAPDLEWSHRVANAGRAALETFGPWAAGPGRVDFAVEPGDFAGPGPHRLVLETRVRTVGLTSPWELDLPHVPFSFEFDANSKVESILGSSDDARSERFQRAVSAATPDDTGSGPRFLDLSADLALRNPPEIRVDGPLPADLAHRVALEIEGHAGPIPAGSIVVAGHAGGSAPATRRLEIGPIRAVAAAAGPTADAAPGPRRMRLILTADPGLGWADPDVRSVWPGTIETNWVEGAIVRR